MSVKFPGGAVLPVTLEERELFVHVVDGEDPKLYTGPSGGGAPVPVSGAGEYVALAFTWPAGSPVLAGPGGVALAGTQTNLAGGQVDLSGFQADTHVPVVAVYDQGEALTGFAFQNSIYVYRPDGSPFDMSDRSGEAVYVRILV